MKPIDPTLDIASKLISFRHQYTSTVNRAKALVDDATDSVRFVGESLRSMQQHTGRCEEAIAAEDPNRMVENTSTIARLANRVLQLTKQEAENSEDPRYISVLNVAADQLQARVSPMVQEAKAVAINIADQASVEAWRLQNSLLLEAVQNVHRAVHDTHSGGGDEPPLPPYPDMAALRLDGYGDDTPPRPPPPSARKVQY